MFAKYKLKDFDFKLILMVIALSYIGVMAVGSAEESLHDKQLYGVIFGLIIMIVISLINYNFILKFYWVYYILNIVLLLSVALLGEDANNSQRWLTIGPIRFQPSETAKILLILFFAQFIMKYREKLNTLKIIAECIFLVVTPLVLIIKQPDLSTSIVIAIIFCIVMFAGGLSFKIIFGLLAVAIPIFAIVISLLLNTDLDLLQGYQLNRILAFLNPEEYPDLVYQQQNSVTAIGSGRLDGKGYKNNEISSVKNGNFISEDQTDFIFAVIGEEFGFKGCVVVIILLMGIALECINVARRAHDVAGRIIAAGVGGLIAFQAFFNIGVATFIMPNTGLTLPFVSYGLTSLVSLFAGIGFVLNVRLQPSKVDNSNRFIASDFDL